MRFDDIGMFWEDIQSIGRGKKVQRAMPPIPDTGWKTPKDLPNLSAAKVISLDTETWDPELETGGPGWARGKGHIVGISVGVETGERWYFPMRHEVESDFNMDPEKVLRWARENLGREHQPKVGANLTYDYGWLRQEKVDVKGFLYDVQFAEALLDERALVDLDTLALKYLGIGKETNYLYQWCSDFYGGKVNGKQRANIYRAPPRLVGPYAEADADLPLRIIGQQWNLLQQEGLFDIFLMECRLIRLLVDMRFAGVSVDLNKAEQTADQLRSLNVGLHAQLKDMVGFEVNVDANDSLGQAFDKLGLSYGITPTGKPSFTKDFLEGVQHPIGDLIRDIRKNSKIAGTFIESYILESNINGKVYGQFHPLRGDSGGTRSGRFSSSTPNLQNIPSRDPILAPLVRGMFVPDYGHAAWRKYDYSQIEYRFLAHYAVGPGSDELRAIFQAEPKTDYHETTRQLVHARTGILLDRKPIKNINFGLIYGMGVKRLAAGLGLSKKEGIKLFNAYHEGAPFVKATMDSCSEEARNTGIITTILNRRSRFDLWEPASGYQKALPIEQAVLEYGNITRAYTHKALNRKLQGSAADLMKIAMLRCYEDGVFDVTGVPRLTVHDELDFSDPGGKDEAFKEMHHLLETSLPLKIPILADSEVGADWGHVKKEA